MQIYFSPEHAGSELKSFGLQSISLRFDSLYILLTPMLVFHPCQTAGYIEEVWAYVQTFARYNESGQCFAMDCLDDLCRPPHIGFRTGYGMWRSLWCCMSNGI
jgi:hypothetical protein